MLILFKYLFFHVYHLQCLHLFQSVIRICFHERRLQYMEKEQMTLWQKSRPGDRILEVDVPLSYGLCDVSQPSSAHNTIHFSWDPTKEVGVYIKVRDLFYMNMFLF